MNNKVIIILLALMPLPVFGQFLSDPFSPSKLDEPLGIEFSLTHDRGYGLDESFNKLVAVNTGTFNLRRQTTSEYFRDNAGAGANYTSFTDGPVTQGLSQVTVMAWIKLQAGDGDAPIIGRGRSADGPNGGYCELFHQSGLSRFDIRTSAGTGIAFTNNPIPLDIWVHFAGTWDGTTVKLYTNGIFADESPIGGIWGAAQTPEVRCGATPTRSADIEGPTDQYKWWSLALSQIQVVDVYTKERVRHREQD